LSKEDFFSLIVGFAVIMFGVIWYNYSYSLAKEKREETEVIFLSPDC